jgi:hypothetical protein
MRIKRVMKYIDGFMPVLEAVEGEYLQGGRMVYDGPVFEQFFDALYAMGECMKSNLECGRRVQRGMVVPFQGMVGSLVRAPDRPRPRSPILTDL